MYPAEFTPKVALEKSQQDRQPRCAAASRSAVCAWCREPAGHTLRECPSALNREEAVAALLQSRDLLRKLADSYFCHRSEVLLELMMRADRMLSPNTKLTDAQRSV